MLLTFNFGLGVFKKQTGKTNRKETPRKWRGEGQKEKFFCYFF